MKSPLHYMGRGFRGGAETTPKLDETISTIRARLSAPLPVNGEGEKLASIHPKCASNHATMSSRT